MSSHYSLEPQPTASVILHTTQGELSVELFAKQTPVTCRNFLQHCLDGYYDNTIFHRLVPGFILQGGDPTGTGNGGESIYDAGAFAGDLDPWPMDQRRGKNAGLTGIGMKDEFHSRLKFNRRGLLGMANESSPDTNGSQFFFTLDKADEITQKNTMFGRIAGDTIYNLAKMGEAELPEGSDRPIYPAKITRVEILINPFDDMIKRDRVARTTSVGAKKTMVADRKKKKKVDKKLLSFGDDDGGEEDIAVIKKPKYDTRIVAVVEDEEDNSSIEPRPPKKPKMGDKKGKVPATSLEKKGDGDDVDMESRSRSQPDPSFPRQKPRKRRPSAESLSDATSEDDAPQPTKRQTLLDKTNAEIAELKASMRRERPSHAPRDETAEKTETGATAELVPENAVRGRKRKHGGASANETRAMADLSAWMSKLDKAPAGKKIDHVAPQPESGAGDGTNPGGDEEAELCDLHFIANCMSCKTWDTEDRPDSDDEGWMANALTAGPDKLGKDLSFRRKAEEELVVIDPREKAKNIQDEKRSARESRGGGSGREWDQARNAKLARASALVGRGAR